MTTRNRRQFLAAASSALVALAAGCQGDGGGSTASPDGTSTATDEMGTPSGDYEQRAREFVDLVDRGEYETAHDRLSPAAAEAIPLDRLRSSWEAQESQLGPFQSLTNVSVGRREGSPVVEGHLIYENGRLRSILTFGSEGIDGFVLRPIDAEWTAPEYADRAAFTEREISLPATDGCSLGGTLSIPEDATAGETPGVVIVHGSGPIDRDATYGPNRIYRDLAWGLASEGVAVLRYDKRSFACDVDLANATVHDIVTEDALTAVDRLRETDAVAAEDVLVAGHSVGGRLTPEIARRDGNLAGIAMLAALHRPVHEAIVDQNEFMVERDGTVTDEEEAALEEVRAMAERIRTLDIADDEVVHLGGDEYWRTLQEYDHEAVARELELPQLYLQGGRDWQVTVEDDFQAWQDALEGKDDVSFTSYDDLNHHLMPGSGEPSQSEYFQENHVDERVISDLVDFAERTTNE